MAGGTVLVVDDNEAMRMAVTDLLTDAGHVVHEAASGTQAIEYLRSNRPDLVLLDLVMPDVSGWTVLEAAGSSDAPPPVILCSGMDEAAAPGHLRRCVVGCLQKPYRLTHLLRMCEAVIAARPVVPAGGTRRGDRRVFVTDVSLELPHGTAASAATVVEVSADGFRLELPFGDDAAGIDVYQRLRIVFRLPGDDRTIELAGQVRWREDAVVGVKITEADAGYAAVLEDLLKG
jgi:CheY-like chemotaxis protein